MRVRSSRRSSTTRRVRGTTFRRSRSSGGGGRGGKSGLGFHHRWARRTATENNKCFVVFPRESPCLPCFRGEYEIQTRRQSRAKARGHTWQHAPFAEFTLGEAR